MGDGGEIGEGRFQNLDKDKELELVDRSDAFLYFDDLAYVSSPRPLLIFDYNQKSGKFGLANKKFNSFILKDENTWIERARAVRGKEPSQYMVNVFSILLDYIYAGEETKGWKFYDTERASKEAGYFHNEEKIKIVLQKDKAYKLIYSR